MLLFEHRLHQVQMLWASRSILSPRERKRDWWQGTVTLADINRLINSKYEANLRRNMSLTDQRVSSHNSAKNNNARDAERKYSL